ncbi:GDSL-type esterase/lipase family protein [Streptomyces roseolilacinus]|uniref:SGNH hydrolase-type esterase domain-containing protein n=1 Tax=Streptomyces roseolilacinus TaxID=66904 RepID=A0A918AZ43_9ACTN|nr:GDSL-type esterase/lipase family protein [Streptomyces roseolilacinus]GGQ05152.1 hypothetical protein GCM10010249_24570 [Streptomyces roseolilacinus]
MRPRFMFVGDSMTIGSAGEHTWRYRMWQHLEASLGPGGYAIVGPRTTLYDPEAGAAVSTAYADPAFPEEARAHLAGWGEGWLHMAPLVGEAVAATGANVLLVSLGLIDLGFYTNSDQTVENVRAFLAAARAADPDVRAVLLPVIPNIRAEEEPPFAAECARFNRLLAQTVADLHTRRSPLVLAAPPADYDLRTDTYDGTHPGPAGEHKLAAAFVAALFSRLVPPPGRWERVPRR